MRVDGEPATALACLANGKGDRLARARLLVAPPAESSARYRSKPVSAKKRVKSMPKVCDAVAQL